MGLRSVLSLVFATRLTRPFTLMFSKSFGFRNIRSSVLYLLHDSAGQWHTICTLFSFLSPHSHQSCCCVTLSLNIGAVRVVWPVNSPTATVSFGLLIAWRFIVLLSRGALISVLDWQHLLQAFHLHRCHCLKWLVMTSLLTAKGMPIIW